MIASAYALTRERIIFEKTCSRVALVAMLAIAAAIGSGAAARAELRVCNKSHVLVNLAVGANDGEDFATEGWWTVTPGSCATPLLGSLQGRYIYLYATDINAGDLLAGAVSMCIDRGKFRVVGIADCWRRGLQAVNFAEIDTLDARDWTTFLTDVGK